MNWGPGLNTQFQRNRITTLKPLEQQMRQRDCIKTILRNWVLSSVESSAGATENENTASLGCIGKSYPSECDVFRASHLNKGLKTLQKWEIGWGTDAAQAHIHTYSVQGSQARQQPGQDSGRIYFRWYSSPRFLPYTPTFLYQRLSHSTTEIKTLAK